MSKNCLVESKEAVVCEGIGTSKDEAIESAFKSMRVKLQEIIPEPIIGISADAIECLSYDMKTDNEAFLYFFMKRQKTYHKVELKIHLTVKHVQIGGA